ncbi:MAG: LTA synthase family protein [Bacteroidota bacterium]|nr:LTA synthase family protein [Bacteroidota bacterium]
MFFGIFDDDTKAVLDSVWSDYPLFWIIVIIVTFVFTLKFAANKILKSEPKKNLKLHWALKTVAFILISGIYALAMRGSVGIFPLQNDDTTISDNLVVNTLSYNGVYAFKNALKEKKNQTIDTDINRTLKRYGYKNAEQPIKEYLKNDFVKDSDLKKQLYIKTPKNDFLKKNPPKVVFFLMESLGNHYITFQSPEFDLLGNLGKELKNCYHYKNFVSCTGGTIHSLEGLMISSPKTPISQSSFLDKNLSSSAAYPFKKNGYNTTFVTGGKLGWRNLDKFVPNQYFNNVYGKSKILKSVKNSSENGWGVYDQYLFDFIYNDLNKNTNKPNFYFVLSTTNHTPFELPTEYSADNINIPDSVLTKIKVSEDIAKKNFKAYRYSNDYLGAFINKIRNSKLGKNTIIVITGDHSCKQLFNYPDKDLFLKMSVPLIMYVPEEYKSENNINMDVFGSHKDIFPTVFNLSLSDTEYFKSGNNLMNYNPETDYFGIYSYSVSVNKYGCEFLDNKLSYKWADISGHLKPTNYKFTPELKELHQHSKAFVTSMNYNIQMELKEQTN